MSYQDEYYWSVARPYIEAATGCSGDDDEIFAAARKADLPVHYLKRIANPRIDRAAGMIKAVWPRTLLDVGTGSGYLIWRLQEEMFGLEMAAVDIKEHRARLVQSICAAAKIRCRVSKADGADLPFDTDSFDAACLFEVLEHVENPVPVMREALRVSRRDVFLSVPCKPDDNPQHVRLFTEGTLKKLIAEAAGVNPPLTVVTKDRNHYYAFASKRSWTVSSEQSDGVRTSLGPRP